MRRHIYVSLVYYSSVYEPFNTSIFTAIDDHGQLYSNATNYNLLTSPLYDIDMSDGYCWSIPLTIQFMIFKHVKLSNVIFNQ